MLWQSERARKVLEERPRYQRRGLSGGPYVTMATPKQARASDDYDHLFKIVLLGDSGVGKSNLLLRFAHGDFQTASKPTIGVEFATVSLTIEGALIKAQIWDTAGQERYRAITSAYYRGAVGALLVYDLTSRRSFLSVRRWLEELRAHSNDDTVLVMVGNKADLADQREIDAEEGKKLAEEEGLLFMETSALSGVGVRPAFERLIREVFSAVVTRRGLGGAEPEEQDSPEVDEALRRGRKILVQEAVAAAPAGGGSCCG